MIKNLAFYLVMLGLMLILLEGFAFLAVQLVDQDDFFDSRQNVFSRLKADDLANFSATRADPVTGWRNIGPRVLKRDNCLGESIEYRYDHAGARLYEWFNEEKTQIVVVGDSYTKGSEVSAGEAYPARLSAELGVSVANLGVGGYGPTQSLLNLEKNISKYPDTKVVVLGVMYENLYRMVNSYRPVLYGLSSYFTLKPYMAAGQIVPHPGSQVFRSLEQFIHTADKSFDQDFWAKPVAEFPYLLAIGRSLSSNHIYYRRLQREFRKLGRPEYFLIFDDEEIKFNLIALLNEYAVMTEEWGVQPVVIFMPRNRLDTTSASKFIAQNRSKINSNLLIGDVAEFSDVDWVKFNIHQEDSDNICHPSPYGYQIIADYTADFMRRNNVWPTP